MQTTEPDSRKQGNPQAVPTPRKTGCLLWIAAAVLTVFLLLCAAFACLMFLDPGPGDEGEEYTMSRRMERYKVAAQFIWYDLKDAVARKFSQKTQTVSCPVEPPDLESEPESESDPESEPESESASGL